LIGGDLSVDDEAREEAEPPSPGLSVIVDARGGRAPHRLGRHRLGHCRRGRSTMRPSATPPWSLLSWPPPLVAAAAVVKACGGRAPHRLGRRCRGRRLDHCRHGRSGRSTSTTPPLPVVATASCGHHRLGHRLLWVLPWPPPCGQRCGEERGGVGRERRESERGGSGGEKRGRGAVMLGYIISTIHSLGFFCQNPCYIFIDRLLDMC
jgi:hypothetical protein